MALIGELSEEAAAAGMNNIKRFRLQNTRKILRVTLNTDIMNILLLSSDPFITGQLEMSFSNCLLVYSFVEIYRHLYPKIFVEIYFNFNSVARNL